MNYTDHTHQEQVPSLLLFFFFPSLLLKGRKYWCMGWLTGVLIRERLHRRPRRQERPFQWARLLLSSTRSFRVGYHIMLLFQVPSTPLQARSQDAFPSGSLQIKWSLYFCKCEKSLLRVSFYSSYRVDSFVPYRPSRDILISYCVL